MSEWRTISIPRELVTEIEKRLNTSVCKGISEFVSEAIRLRLEELTRVEIDVAEKRGEVCGIEQGNIEKIVEPRPDVQCTALRIVQENPLQIQTK
jgi:metal-responsive CopG/Arc/MetJ family transcriptional regulator